MKNIYTDEIRFKFDSVSTFGYSDKTKYASGILRFDEKGNGVFDCNSYSYCDYIDLLTFLGENFENEYTYRNVSIDFYGKNTRSVRVGRTYIEVSAEDKIFLSECFIPDMVLGLRIIQLYDSIKPYGFNRKFLFTNKTSEEIINFFEVKFVNFEEIKKSHANPRH